MGVHRTLLSGVECSQGVRSWLHTHGRGWPPTCATSLLIEWHGRGGMAAGYPCVAQKLLLWQAPKKNALIEGIKMVTNTFWQKTDKPQRSHRILGFKIKTYSILQISTFFGGMKVAVFDCSSNGQLRFQDIWLATTKVSPYGGEG